MGETRRPSAVKEGNRDQRLPCMTIVADFSYAGLSPRTAANDDSTITMSILIGDRSREYHDAASEVHKSYA